MGTVTSKAPNPNILDRNDPRYTPLNEFNAKIGARALISDLGATMGGRIHEHLYAVENMPLGDILKSVQAGDIAIIGNRSGMVVDVLTGTNMLTKTDVVAIKVYEDMRYLPIDWKADPAGFGYDNSLAKVGRTITYILGNVGSHAGTITAINNFKVAGKTCQPGSHSLYAGQIDIIKQKTYDPQTWTTIAQAMKKFHEKYLPSEKVTFTSKGHNFTAVEKKLTIQYLNDVAGSSLPLSSTQVDIKAIVDALNPVADAAIITLIVARLGGVPV